ncbi:hypothetical protein ACUOCP_50025, partial [Escherichia sp. R-CC3]
TGQAIAATGVGIRIFNHYNVDSKALMSFRSLRVYRDNKSVTFAELDVFDLSEALSAPDVIFH